MKKLTFLLLFISNFLFAQEKLRILVLDFDTVGDSLLADDGVIFANSVEINLVKNDKKKQIMVLERDKMPLLLREQSEINKGKGLFDSKYIIELGKIVGANYVVFGQLSKTVLHTGILLSVKIVSIETSQIEYANELSIQNDKDYQKVVDLITKSLMENIEFNLKPEKIKQKELFISDLKKLCGEYAQKDTRFIILSTENINLGIPLPNFSGMNNLAEKIAIFREMGVYKKRGMPLFGKQKKIEYPQITILITDEAIICQQNIEPELKLKLKNGKLITTVVTYSLNWEFLANSSISYSLSQNEKKIKIGTTEINCYESTTAGLLHPFLAQIKKHILNSGFL